MSNPAPLRTWLTAPMSAEVAEAIERLRHAPDVRHVAVMPDVHLASEVCIGVAMATTRLIYPQAVGGDIGCGMLAVRVDADAEAPADPRIAGKLLADLGRVVPARRRNRREALPQPEAVSEYRFEDPSLEALRRGDGALEFGTLGSGNHFLELQVDGHTGELWLMVHSGSRAMGPAIRQRHQSREALDSETAAGAAYLRDAEWARRYADASRRAIARQVERVFAPLLWETAITTDHNHVGREVHGGVALWLHRKGAMRAREGEMGVLPGSMGTLSFHVRGRGEAESLCSSAHGAGRMMSRSEARSRIAEKELRRQMEGVWYDTRIAGQLRDEAPAAYKDIRAVLEAQRDLVSVVRTLRPVLVYKGV